MIEETGQAVRIVSEAFDWKNASALAVVLAAFLWLIRQIPTLVLKLIAAQANMLKVFKDEQAAEREACDVRNQAVLTEIRGANAALVAAVQAGNVQLIENVKLGHAAIVQETRNSRDSLTVLLNQLAQRNYDATMRVEGEVREREDRRDRDEQRERRRSTHGD